MLKRDPKDLKAAEAELRRNMRRWPEAGVVIGAVNLRPDPDSICDVAVLGIDFNAVHWVALADSALEHAVKKMAAMREPPLDLIKSCERARAALDFVERAADG